MAVGWEIHDDPCLPLFVFFAFPPTGTASMSGHRSNVICLDHHPHGDYFASGSVDTNLKIWDIRKKTCIQVGPFHATVLYEGGL